MLHENKKRIFNISTLSPQQHQICQHQLLDITLWYSVVESHQSDKVSAIDVMFELGVARQIIWIPADDAGIASPVSAAQLLLERRCGGRGRSPGLHNPNIIPGHTLHCFTTTVKRFQSRQILFFSNCKGDSEMKIDRVYR